jgi:hypothetical protein
MGRRGSFPRRFAEPIPWLAIAVSLVGCGLEKLVNPPADVRQGQLRFTGEPRNTLRNVPMAPPVTVSAVDVNGTLDTSYAGNVTIRLDANPTGGVLAGTLTRRAVAGVATFTDLSVDQPGDGYTLAALADAMSSAISGSFRVQDDRLVGLQAIAGDGQSDSVGATLQAYVVEAQDGAGLPLVGQTVHWSAGSGTIVPSASITDASGRASATRSLGTTVGPDTAIATLEVGSAPSVIFVATATPAAPAVLGVVVQPSPASVGQAITPPVTVRIADRYGNPAVQFTGPITIGLGANPTGATLKGTLAQSPVGGIATFPDLTIDQPGSGYTLSATAGSLNPVTTAPFAVLVSAPVLSLSYRQQPTDGHTKSAIAPPVAIEVRDQSNQLVTSFTGSITIGITPGTGTSSARLSGKTTQPVRSGVAVFGNLTIDKPGSGYRLRARSSFGFLDSAPFTLTAGK